MAKFPLPEAAVDWETGQALRSTVFNDVYFSDLGGLEETHHVFLAGNDLAVRFQGLASCPKTHFFTIAELGFGTGLNLLAAWMLWQKRDHQTGHLHFVSTEGFPLSKNDFIKAQKLICRLWPDLKPFSEQLIHAYPVLVEGYHRIALSQDVTLTLLFGDAHQQLTKCQMTADAWFLDGFSPAENDAMWTEELMTLVGHKTAAEGTFATFTVAGHVRRKLQAAGFTIEKSPGFGRKRHMLRGKKTASPPSSLPLTKLDMPWYARSRPPAQKSVSIIGAGIAGAATAYACKRAGLEVTVYDAKHPAAGASGNPAGLIMPRLDLGETPATRYYVQSYLHALSLYKDLSECFTPCGGLQIASTEKDSIRFQKIATSQILPPSHIQLISLAEAEKIAGTRIQAPADLKHLYFPQAGIVKPVKLVQYLLSDIAVIPETPFLADSKLYTDQHIVFANGVHAGAMNDNKTIPLPLAASLGQLEMIHDTQLLNCIISKGAYAAPLSGKTLIGATYLTTTDLQDPRVDNKSTAANIEMVQDFLPNLEIDKVTTPRAALRCVTPDQHPVIGRVPNWHVYEQSYSDLSHGRRRSYPPAQYHPYHNIITALGSRGLVTAPLLGEMLASELIGNPSPVASDIYNMLHPARFWIRHIKRTAFS